MLIILGKDKELQKLNYKKYIKTNEVKHLDLTKKNFETVIMEAQNDSIFQVDKKTIVIHNWNFLKNGKSLFQKEKIINFLKKASNDHDFILLFDNDKESKTIQELSTICEVIKPITFTNYDKKVMIMSILKKEKMSIENDALNILIKMSSNSPEQLYRSIKKLSLIDGNNITSKDVLDNIFNNKEENIFIPIMVKKIIKNNYNDLIKDYQILKNNGWHDVVIISLLIRCLIKERNIIFEKSNIISEKENLLLQKINFIINALLNLDLKIKKSQIESKIGIQLLLLKLKETPWMN